jgi:hypothetical protein
LSALFIAWKLFGVLGKVLPIKGTSIPEKRSAWGKPGATVCQRLDTHQVLTFKQFGQ